MRAGRHAFLANPGSGFVESGDDTWYARSERRGVRLAPSPSVSGELPPGGFVITPSGTALGVGFNGTDFLVAAKPSRLHPPHRHPSGRWRVSHRIVQHVGVLLDGRDANRRHRDLQQIGIVGRDRDMCAARAGNPNALLHVNHDLSSPSAPACPADTGRRVDPKARIDPARVLRSYSRSAQSHARADWSLTVNAVPSDETSTVRSTRARSPGLQGRSPARLLAQAKPRRVGRPPRPRFSRQVRLPPSARRQNTKPLRHREGPSDRNAWLRGPAPTTFYQHGRRAPVHVPRPEAVRSPEDFDARARTAGASSAANRVKGAERTRPIVSRVDRRELVA